MPSIGSTCTYQITGSGEPQEDVTGADSAVDLTSPSPTTSSTDVRGSIAARQTDSRRKHWHDPDSRGSSGEGRSAKKTAKIDKKSPPAAGSMACGTNDDNIETRGRRAVTRGASKSKSSGKGKQPVPPRSSSKDTPNIEVPPEPPKDAPNTVMLKVRLPSGEYIQRRFDYQTSCIRDVVHYAKLAADSKDARLTEKGLTLSTNFVPKVVFSDHSLTLAQAGLVHNTLLHLDCQDL